MIAIDSNILIRYITNDDPAQAATVNDLFEHELTRTQPGFVAAIVLCETLWVLRTRHRYDADALRQVAKAIREAAQLVLEHDDCVAFAIEAAQADLPDAIMHFIGKKLGCTRTLTFDKKFARLDGVELLI